MWALGIILFMNLLYSSFFFKCQYFFDVTCSRTQKVNHICTSNLFVVVFCWPAHLFHGLNLNLIKELWAVQILNSWFGLVWIASAFINGYFFYTNNKSIFHKLCTYYNINWAYLVKRKWYDHDNWLIYVSGLKKTGVLKNIHPTTDLIPKATHSFALPGRQKPIPPRTQYPTSRQNRNTST